MDSIQEPSVFVSGFCFFNCQRCDLWQQTLLSFILFSCIIFNSKYINPSTYLEPKFLAFQVWSSIYAGQHVRGLPFSLVYRRVLERIQQERFAMSKSYFLNSIQFFKTNYKSKTTSPPTVLPLAAMAPWCLEFSLPWPLFMLVWREGLQSLRVPQPPARLPLSEQEQFLFPKIMASAGPKQTKNNVLVLNDANSFQWNVPTKMLAKSFQRGFPLDLKEFHKLRLLILIFISGSAFKEGKTPLMGARKRM